MTHPQCCIVKGIQLDKYHHTKAFSNYENNEITNKDLYLTLKDIIKKLKEKKGEITYCPRISFNNSMEHTLPILFKRVKIKPLQNTRMNHMSNENLNKSYKIPSKSFAISHIANKSRRLYNNYHNRKDLLSERKKQMETVKNWDRIVKVNNNKKIGRASCRERVYVLV